MNFLRFFVILLIWITNIQTEATLIEKLHFFNNPNYYLIHSSVFQQTFSLDGVMRASLEMAMESCQNDFKFERWNCPSTDFFRRHSSQRYQIDREDAYVSAIVTAAALYTITKDCASGITSICGCNNANSMAASCSDDPEQAAALYTKFSKQNCGNDFRGLMMQHNFKAVSTLLKQSLIRQCGCTMNGCSETDCVNVLRPFAEIAKDIKLMYDEGLQLMAGKNIQVLWSNIPLDSLVYAAESPNYCDLDAVPHWNGMHNRQCLQTKESNEEAENRSSCENLCYACGFDVREKNVVTEYNCNCKFSWNFQVQCERCTNVETQYFCS